MARASQQPRLAARVPGGRPEPSSKGRRLTITDSSANAKPEQTESASIKTVEGLSPCHRQRPTTLVEVAYRPARRVTRMLRVAGLRSGKPLEDFDWSFQAGVDRPYAVSQVPRMASAKLAKLEIAEADIWL